MKKLAIWLVSLAVIGYFGAKMTLHSKVSSDLDLMLLAVRPYADIDYRGVSSTITGELSIDGISVNIERFDDPLYIDKVAIITPGFWYLISLDDMDRGPNAGDIPESLGFVVEGLRAPVDADYFETLYALSRQELGAAGAGEDAADECTGKFGYSPETLKRLGYTDLAMDMYLSYELDGGKFRVEFGASLEDMYDIDVALNLAGDMSARSLARGAYRPKMIGGRVEYVDRSLDARATDLCVRDGLSEEQVLQAKLDAFRAMGEQNGIVFDDLVIEPYRDFLRGKSTFIIRAEPSEPVNLSQIGLYKPSDVPALLNLTAEAR